jgi:hypothetical protein
MFNQLLFSKSSDYELMPRILTVKKLLIERLDHGGILIRVALEGSAVTGLVIHLLNFMSLVAQVSVSRLLYFKGAIP